MRIIIESYRILLSFIFYMIANSLFSNAMNENYLMELAVFFEIAYCVQSYPILSSEKFYGILELFSKLFFSFVYIN